MEEDATLEALEEEIYSEESVAGYSIVKDPIEDDPMINDLWKSSNQSINPTAELIDFIV